MAVLIVLVLAAGAGFAVASRTPTRQVGYGQIRVGGHGPEWWRWQLILERRQVRTLNQRVALLQTRARHLKRTLLHRPSSLEALRLAAVAYDVPFELLYRRASCESTGSLPASPASERTLYAWARNRSSSAKGLLQFLDSTWTSTPYGRESVYSPYANALAAGWMIGEAGRGGEWSCR